LERWLQAINGLVLSKIRFVIGQYSPIAVPEPHRDKQMDGTAFSAFLPGCLSTLQTILCADIALQAFQYPLNAPWRRI
jgi:hypothetical protein